MKARAFTCDRVSSVFTGRSAGNGDSRQGRVAIQPTPSPANTGPCITTPR